MFGIGPSTRPSIDDSLYDRVESIPVSLVDFRLMEDRVQPQPESPGTPQQPLGGLQ